MLLLFKTSLSDSKWVFAVLLHQTEFVMILKNTFLLANVGLSMICYKIRKPARKKEKHGYSGQEISN